MAIIKYKYPINLIKKRGMKTINYSKWIIDLRKLENIKNSCDKLLDFYNNYPLFKQLPITISFSKIIPKSNRISYIFKNNNKKPMQIGSNYIFNKNELSKIDLVYACTKNDLINTINKINSVISSFSLEIINKINEINNFDINMNEKNNRIIDFLKQTVFWNHNKYIFNDLNYIESVKINISEKFSQSPIISIYDIIDFDIFKEILKKDGIILQDNDIVANEFININIDDLNKIIDKYPFIISQTFEDIEINFNNENNLTSDFINIINSQNSNTIIGIIDTACVLKENWKSYHDKANNYLPKSLTSDFNHGTAVSSLIIGRDYINNYFKDNLGEYNVRTFESIPNGKINTFYLMKTLETIIKNNNDIKIWNLSFGGYRYNSKISVFGKLLDILQYKNNIQFIVASGNDGPNNLNSPADSLSAISVGALYENTKGNLIKTSYSSSGKVFGIFEKPSTYEIGNDFTVGDYSNNKLYMLSPSGTKVIDQGTSFAAPLVTRKVAYLYEKYSINLETTRAIINYLSKISKDGIANLQTLENDDIFLFIEGEILPGDKKSIPINLPYDFSTKLTEFSVGCAISYNVANTRNLGDEYSCVEISIKLVKHFFQNGKLQNETLIKTNKNSGIDGKNATETELRKIFGKYNPNTVLIDKNFIKNKGTKINDLKGFSLVAERIDLFDHINEPIKYGVIIHLRETNKGSLKNFISLNQENILEVIQSQDIELHSNK